MAKFHHLAGFENKLILNYVLSVLSKIQRTHTFSTTDDVDIS